MWFSLLKNHWNFSPLFISLSLQIEDRHIRIHEKTPSEQQNFFCQNVENNDNISVAILSVIAATTGLKYRAVFAVPEFESYLTALLKQFLMPVCQFQMSNHKLQVEKGRCANVPYNDAFAGYCM